MPACVDPTREVGLHGRRIGEVWRLGCAFAQAQNPSHKAHSTIPYFADIETCPSSTRIQLESNRDESGRHCDGSRQFRRRSR